MGITPNQNVPETGNQSSTSQVGTSHLERLSSFYSSSPLAEAAIARDIEDEALLSGEDDDMESDDSSSRLPLAEHSMASSYRRPSFVGTGPRSAVLPAMLQPEHVHLSRAEREQVLGEERSLLRDCEVIPPKRPRVRRSSEDNVTARLSERLSIGAGLRQVKSHPDEETGGFAQDRARADEQSPLLGGADLSMPYGGLGDPENINKKWEEAVEAGLIHTTWQREAKVLAKYSRSLIATFLLQYSLTVASIFTVGHIGKVELGAISLAGMTANITGYAVYQGLATSLDTLCAQAYGSGRKKLVGLQLQRMVYFLWVVTIPIAIIWLLGTQILEAIVPEKETARLAGLALKILIIGAPGYAAFEAGKRFVQAQGLFTPTLYVLLFCAPLNAFMNWLFVWHFGWGFVGAPIAIAITETLLPLTLFLYVYFVRGRECWGGFSRRALSNWGPMVRLALPGLVMVLAEFLAFEILTLSSSWLGTTHLAAQTILSTVAAITFQIPFPMSVAASTRIANLIGATLAGSAKCAARVALVAAVGVGILNITLLSTLRNFIPLLFTSDHDVIALVGTTLPLVAAFQLFDALATNCNGILRGLGRQDIGGYVNLAAYYAIAMPISFGTGFGLGWGLPGLWLGPAIALFLVSATEGLFLARTNWDNAVEAAVRRNSLG